MPPWTTRITQQVGASFGTAVVAVAPQSLLAHGAASAFQGAFWWAIGISAHPRSRPPCHRAAHGEWHSADCQR
jgi:hypothetical protein